MFWSHNRLRRVGVKLALSYLFWIENCYLVTWNLANILMNLKSFTKAIRTFWICRDIFFWNHHISAFSTGNLAFTCFCCIANYSSIFLFLVCWRGLKSIKFKKEFFFYLPIFAMQNNPLMQLRLIFHKMLIKTNWNFKSQT